MVTSSDTYGEGKETCHSKCIKCQLENEDLYHVLYKCQAYISLRAGFIPNNININRNLNHRLQKFFLEILECCPSALGGKLGLKTIAQLE